VHCIPTVCLKVKLNLPVVWRSVCVNDHHDTNDSPQQSRTSILVHFGYIAHCIPSSLGAIDSRSYAVGVLGGDKDKDVADAVVGSLETDMDRVFGYAKQANLLPTRKVQVTSNVLRSVWRHWLAVKDFRLVCHQFLANRRVRTLLLGASMVRYPCVFGGPKRKDVVTVLARRVLVSKVVQKVIQLISSPASFGRRQ
jgi:hypothetical protein